MDQPIGQEAIQAAIRRELPSAEVLIQSDDGTHFVAVVVSDEFVEMPLVRQHQAVLNALKADFDSERLHALQLKTFTPDKWRAELERRAASPLSLV